MNTELSRIKLIEKHSRYHFVEEKAKHGDSVDVQREKFVGKLLSAKNLIARNILLPEAILSTWFREAVWGISLGCVNLGRLGSPGRWRSV
jgi:hypothetical protein